MYSLLPFWYFGGVLALILVGCILVLLWTGKRRALGLWIFWTCVIYTILFWGVITATTGIDRDYILSAKWRHTPGSEPGTSNLVTLEYLAYPDCYERVNSPRIYQYLISKNSEFATITLRVSYDFGRVRGYGLQKVDDLPVNQSWVSGSPPWQIFSRRNFASRWLRFAS